MTSQTLYSSKSLCLFRHVPPFCIAALLPQYILSWMLPQKIHGYPRYPGMGSCHILCLFSYFSKTKSFLILDMFIFFFFF